MSLYNLRHDGDQYRVSKFDNDLNVESTYLMTATECTCPAGHRHTCRHRQMFTTLVQRIDSHWMFDFERTEWIATATEDTDVVSMTPDPTERSTEDEDGFGDRLDEVIRGERGLTQADADGLEVEHEYEEPEGLDEGPTDVEGVDEVVASDSEPTSTRPTNWRRI